MQITVTDLFDGVTPEASPITIAVIEGTATSGGGGVSDHGALAGLTDDDHPQYHNDARGDARYDALGDAAAAQTAAEATAASALATHSADTTAVHGIADTSALATTASVATAVSAHEADTTNVHGIADTSALATTASVTSAISAHEADTTSVHGIANTANLETTTGAQTKVDAHVNDTSAAHAASAISFSPTGTIAATDVQAAIAEVASEAGQTVHRMVTFSKAGALTTATGTHRIYNDSGSTRTITAVRASVGTAPTGSSLLVDVHKNGTTIFTTQSNRPTVAASSNTDKADAVEVTSWADGDYLTVDIDQVGSTVAGSDLTVTVTYS